MVTFRQPSTVVKALVTSLAILVLAPAAALAQSRFSGIVVFGTSLSDPGNAFALRGAHATPHDYTLNPLLVPDAPYARGGHHFSNGDTWIEQYARSIGLAASANAALATTDLNATNFAVGAARAYEDGKNFNLGRQVDAFLSRAGGVAPANALYVIEMGGNDVRDALAVYGVGGNGGAILSQAVGSIAVNIQRLYRAGAREFLVWTAPNVGLTPAIRSLPPGTSAFAAQVSQGFNNGLAQALGQLTMALPGITFTRLDAFGLLGEIVATPAAFGLTDATRACVTIVAPFQCDRPAEFLFWDGIHPTRAGHAILAREMADIVR